MKVKRIYITAVSFLLFSSLSIVAAESENTGVAADTQEPEITAKAETTDNTGSALPNAKAGECYAKDIIPAEYKTESQKLIIKEASSKIEIIPAKYEWVEEKVLIKEASKKLVPVPATYSAVSEKVLVTPAEKIWTKGGAKDAAKANLSLLAGAAANGMDIVNAKLGNCFVEHFIPAQYKTETQQVLKFESSHKIEIIPAKYQAVEEKVLVKEASAKLVGVPAVYDTVTEKVLVKPATTEWKKGRGPVERLDNSTGEIMCLIEVPAVYKTVAQKKIKTLASVKVIEVPAVYKVVKKRKLASPATEKKIEIPAKTEVVTRNVKVKEEAMQWRGVLCETNMSPELITKIQSALKKAGLNPGAVDGKIGNQTMVAVDAYQRKNGLPRGGLTLQTIEKLGIQV